MASLLHHRYSSRFLIFHLCLPSLSLSSKFVVRGRGISTVSSSNYGKTFSHLFQECSYRGAQGPGKQSHCRMIISGFEPTIFVTNCLVQMYLKCFNLGYAKKVFDRMTYRDSVSWNAMVFGYSICGDLEGAQKIFSLAPKKDVITWNSLISGYLQNSDYLTALHVFIDMGRDGVGFDTTTLAVISKVCSAMENYDLGIQIHGMMVKMGFENEVVTSSAMVDMYAKCKRLEESFHLFREMPEKNWVSWSAIIAGCVQNDQFCAGLEFFKRMQREGTSASQSTYASVLRACAGLSEISLGSQLHGHALKAKFGNDVIVATATLDMYAKCHNLSNSRKVFDSLPFRSLQCYNALIVGYTRFDQGSEALQLFLLLLKSGLGFDEISASGALSACAQIKGLMEGIQIHVLVIKRPFCSSVCVANALLDMYGKCGAVVEAHSIFDEMEIKDAVSWNAIIAAYEQNGEEDETLSLLVSMLQCRMEPDDFTYGSVLKVCTRQQALEHGKEIHGRILKSGMGLDSFLGSAIIDMYSKCNEVEEAQKLHCRMEEQTIVSWNTIISGFSLNEKSEEAQKLFAKMMEARVKPDNFTYATVLDTCANLAAVGLGKQIHAQIIKQDMQSDVFITSTLVDMYSKCGNMQDSMLIFERAPRRDFVTWNAMVCGCAHHGLGEKALDVFEKMQLENVKPNHSTFVAVLRACAHMGLVEKGLLYFDLMHTKYGLHPQMEHYSCMMDLLGRSGRITDALKLVEDMPYEADDVIWRTLLSICKMHGNVQVAEKAAGYLLKLDPEDSSAYILLSNIYANAGLWNEVSKMRKAMRFSGLKKEPGCSWIEVKSQLHMFLVADKAHPRSEEIYKNLDLLIDEMKLTGHAPRTGDVLNFASAEDELQELYPARMVSCG